MFSSIQFIGTQRSGSNLLRLILNQHNLISAPHPPHLLNIFVPLVPFYHKRYEIFALDHLIEDMCQMVEDNPVPWTDVVLDRAMIRSNSTSVFDIFEQIYIQKAIADKAQIWCCKSTFNVQFVDELEKRIKPFYIHLYRDGRDVATSFKKIIVGPKHVYHVAKQWREEQTLSMRFLETIEIERKLSIAFEDLLEQPVETIKMICESLGIEYSSAMMKYYKSIESRHTAESGKMWERVVEPIISNNKGKYLTELTLDEIEIFEKVAGDILQELGYPMHCGSNNVTLDVDIYNQLNKNLIDQSVKNATKIELEKRNRQQNSLDQIKNKLQAFVGKSV